jgi:tetratricopeptide (TPR) repeat protein
MKSWTDQLEQHLAAAGVCRSDEAVEHYQAILDLLQPHIRELSEPMRQLRARIDCQLGDDYRELGLLEQALFHLKRSEEWAPGQWETFRALGLAYFEKGSFRDAQGCFQEANRLAPGGCPESYEHIYEMVLRHRDDDTCFRPFFEQALELYEQAGDELAAARCRFRLDSGWGRRLQPEEVLQRAGELDAEQALAALELGYRQHPEHAELAYRLGEAYLARGQQRQACRAFLRAGRLPSLEWSQRARQAAARALKSLNILPAEVRRLEAIR